MIGNPLFMLKQMNIHQWISDSFIQAREEMVFGTSKDALIQARTWVWIKTLGRMLQTRLEEESDVRVFFRHNELNLPDFGMRDFFYDVHACKMATRRTKKKEQVVFVQESLWQVATAFTKDSQQTLSEFSKLIVGTGMNKLLVGPQLANNQTFLDNLKPAAKHCPGTLYVALIPHPREWDSDNQQINLWQFEKNKWISIDKVENTGAESDDE